MANGSTRSSTTFCLVAAPRPTVPAAAQQSSLVGGRRRPVRSGWRWWRRRMRRSTARTRPCSGARNSNRWKTSLGPHFDVWTAANLQPVLISSAASVQGSSSELCTSQCGGASGGVKSTLAVCCRAMGTLSSQLTRPVAAWTTRGLGAASGVRGQATAAPAASVAVRRRCQSRSPWMSLRCWSTLPRSWRSACHPRSGLATVCLSPRIGLRTL
mmetsp:Transcript_26432/g.66518  ORF Transcript_26432/g.66518 Transcript_26432/m.66518 type:complete len:213 (+) Transcript_26432:1069-1707(+)